MSLNERKFGVVKSICCYCRGEYSSPKINKSYVVKVESRDYCKIRWLCYSEKFLSELNEAKTAHWPCSPRSSLSASKSSSAKWVKRLSGFFRTVKNLSKAFGPLFSNKLSNVCDAWMEPNLFSVAFISSLSEGQKTELSCKAIRVGLVMLFMITVVLLANTFLWITSMLGLPVERGSQLQLSLSWWLNCSVDPESREGGFTSLFSSGGSSKLTSVDGVSGLAGVGSLGASDDKESAIIICQDFHAPIVSPYQWVIVITFNQPLTRSKKKDSPSVDWSKTSNVNEKSIPEII